MVLLTPKILSLGGGGVVRIIQIINSMLRVLQNATISLKKNPFSKFKQYFMRHIFFHIGPF